MQNIFIIFQINREYQQTNIGCISPSIRIDTPKQVDSFVVIVIRSDQHVESEGWDEGGGVGKRGIGRKKNNKKSKKKILNKNN